MKNNNILRRFPKAIFLYNMNISVLIIISSKDFLLQHGAKSSRTTIVFTYIFYVFLLNWFFQKTKSYFNSILHKKYIKRKEKTIFIEEKFVLKKEIMK